MIKRRIDPDELLDRLKAVAAPYPTKAMAADLGKPYSTLDNELSARGTSKLGLVTAARMLAMAFYGESPEQSRRAAEGFMDHFCDLFGMVAFNVPQPNPDSPHAPILKMAADLAREFGESVQAIGSALEDGVLTRSEIEHCRKEIRDVICVCAELKAHLRMLEDAR